MSSERPLRARGRRSTAVATALLLAACSGSSSSSKSTTTATTPGTAAVPTSSAPGPSSSTPPVSGPVSTAAPGAPHTATTVVAGPLLACPLLTPIAAAALVGTVRSSTGHVAGSTSSCTFVGINAQVTLSVTDLFNATAAHTAFSEAARSVGNVARGVFGIGDEAFTYPRGISARVGHVLMTLTAPPTVNATALQAAARTVAGNL